MNANSKFGFTSSQRSRTQQHRKKSILNAEVLVYIGVILTILGLVMVTFLHYRKSKLCKGHRFSNAVRIMLFISDIQNYIPIKLCKAAGSIHLCKSIGLLKAESIKLNKNYIWDTVRNRLERQSQ